MKGNEQVLALLNEVLSHELASINQYFVHARMCENWGYERLWKRVREESIEEMRHADRLIERILYFDGVPNIQRLAKINIGQSVPEQLRVDLDVEKKAVQMLNDGIERCRSLGDDGTRELLEDILLSEEKHASWLEAQLSLLEQVGEPNYLAQQIRAD
jgi:bacterioferritin